MFKRISLARVKDVLLLTGWLGFFILGFFAAGHLFTLGKNQTFFLGEEDFASSYAISAWGPRIGHVTTENIPIREEGNSAFYFASPNEIISLPKWRQISDWITAKSYNLVNKQTNRWQFKGAPMSVFYHEGYFIGVNLDYAFLQNSEDQSDYEILPPRLLVKERLWLLFEAGAPSDAIDFQQERVMDASFDRDSNSLYLSAQYNDRIAAIFQYQIDTDTLKLLVMEAQIDTFRVLPNHNIVYKKPEGLFLLDVNSGNSQQLIEGSILNFAVSADGQKLAYTAINERGVTELYGMYMDQRNVKEMQAHSLLYSNLPNVQALEWIDDRLLCINRQPTGSYQLYRFTLKNE
ncbi:hypothetical protein OIN60_10420 [Paenibacillus sp. P96]|uniref:WD40 repeat domain-containing protein n=1 Tax=Paenibacillus zeirhizosphaerae TaxID=2987519 RepID=A0ABT9FR37_9BACL|nr:hypothetical protein [Paenibacillus sp. P96]MDP4097184.1 hypothetical protein [Paenibacillus sp. P96]